MGETLMWPERELTQASVVDTLHLRWDDSVTSTLKSALGEHHDPESAVTRLSTLTSAQFLAIDAGPRAADIARSGARKTGTLERSGR
jgi:hypothetical protein